MSNFNGVKTYHIIYKTTNKLNNMYYIGMHSTNKLNDGYLGSGKRLKRSLKKYGIENFSFEILEFCNSREQLIECETELINQELLCDNNCMNLRVGGTGGFSREQQRKNAIKSNEKQKMLKESDKEWYRNKNDKISKGNKKRYEMGREKKYFYDWNGKKHSEETKEKIKEIKKGCGTGSNNSQYNTCWVNNGIENKKIKRECFNIYSNDWVLGRNMKLYKSN